MRTSAKLLFALVGAAAGLGTLVLLFRQEGDRLTREAVEEAQARWKRAGIRSYDLVVVVKGAQHGEHEIEVRAGEVVSMKTGGVPVERRIWKYWSVEALFRSLLEELDAAERPQRAHGVESSDQLVLRASFDPELGYPRHFLRQVLGGGPGIEWEIRRFTRRPG